MVNDQSTYFRRIIRGERVMLMLPFNVVLVGRVRGTVDATPGQPDNRVPANGLPKLTQNGKFIQIYRFFAR